MTFKNYEDAFKAAVLKARECVAAGLSEAQSEQGLEYNELYREWTVRHLPLPQNRYGHELRSTCARRMATSARTS